MERDYGTEIDELRKDIAEIKELLKPQNKEIIKESKMSEESQEKIDKLKSQAEQNNESGAVSYDGFFQTKNPQGTWESMFGTNYRGAKELMNMPTSKVASVLSSLGNPQRWEIILALLKKPMTVAQIVEEFDMKTSGKAYHHLNSLIAADLVQENNSKNTEKGTYVIKPPLVQGIILIMAGVFDLIDPHYSNGEWNAE